MSNAPNRLIRLSLPQRKFIDSIYSFGDDDSAYWECPYSEARTAISLERMGMVEFSDRPKKGCDWFTARMTEKGLAFLRDE